METDKNKGQHLVKVGRDTTIKSFKTDILTQIQEKYSTEPQKPARNADSKPTGLVPTKATLFGLDIRIRDVDKKIQEQKLGRKPRAIVDGGNSKKYFNLNRHLIPNDQMDKFTGK